MVSGVEKCRARVPVMGGGGAGIKKISSERSAQINLRSGIFSEGAYDRRLHKAKTEIQGACA